MKKGLFLLLVAFLSSCDNSKQLNCNNSKYGNPICLFGFSYEEVDTIKIRLYKKDQSFKKCIDSFCLFPSIVTSQEISAAPVTSIPTDCDWEIEFNDTSIYKVKNILMGIKQRNSFFSSYSECDLISYNLNDSIITQMNINIYAQYPRIRRVSKDKLSFHGNLIQNSKNIRFNEKRQ